MLSILVLLVNFFVFQQKVALVWDSENFWAKGNTWWSIGLEQNGELASQKQWA
jgi:hypothetical protein